MLTTSEVATRLGVTPNRVWALIKAGRLPSQQFGRDHLIKESDVALVADRKPGRPKKADEAASHAPAVTRAEMKADDAVKTATKAKPAKKRATKKAN